MNMHLWNKIVQMFSYVASAVQVVLWRRTIKKEEENDVMI
jgi:hypothetical protein